MVKILRKHFTSDLEDFTMTIAFRLNFENVFSWYLGPIVFTLEKSVFVIIYKITDLLF